MEAKLNICLNINRSALDELAGRGGRGPEDDPLRLTARGLLQFLRARGHEKSLAAAPADLLPASIVCQVWLCVLTYIASCVLPEIGRQNRRGGHETQLSLPTLAYVCRSV